MREIHLVAMPSPLLFGEQQSMALFVTHSKHTLLYNRQLEAIVRIAESLAKMSLAPFALESHIDEALRLFQVSTLDAALSGCLAGGCSL